MISPRDGMGVVVFDFPLLRFRILFDCQETPNGWLCCATADSNLLIRGIEMDTLHSAGAGPGSFVQCEGRVDTWTRHALRCVTESAQRRLSKWRNAWCGAAGEP